MVDPAQRAFDFGGTGERRRREYTLEQPLEPHMCAVEDRPGLARYSGGVKHSQRSASRGADDPEVVPHLCPLSAMDGGLCF